MQKVLIGLVVFVAVVLAMLSVNKYEDHNAKVQRQQAAEVEAIEAKDFRIVQLEAQVEKIKNDCIEVANLYMQVPEESRPLAAVPTCGFMQLP